MYLNHFGLRCFPFTNDIAPDEMFESEANAELITRLSLLIAMRGIGLVTGDSGAGKSATTRKVVSCLNTGLYKTVYVPLSTGNTMDVYKSIAWELGLPTERSRAALYKQIRQEATRLCVDARISPVLVVDEAHHLRSDVLEELRLLTNYAMDSENRLCLLLVGQTELRRRVGMAVHEALNQRIIVRYHLRPLTRDELPRYLVHLLRRAGTEQPLFEPAAVEALHQATHGLPRRSTSWPTTRCSLPHSARRATSPPSTSPPPSRRSADMKQVRIPKHWRGDQALATVAFLESVIAAIWRQHGAAMAHCLYDDFIEPPAKRRSRRRAVQPSLPLGTPDF